MRRNVLGWLSHEFTDASDALVLTHNIDFLFVQCVLVPRLRWAGNPRLTIFADASCAASAYMDQRVFLDGLGVLYRVVPVDLGPTRRFHPKVLLLSNRQRAACAIGSGNLTHGGMSANHEIWTFGTSDGDGASLLAGLREYVRRLVALLPLADPLRDSIDALFDEEQAWVADLPRASGLATSPSDRSLLDQIADIATGEIQSISVLTPYFDEDGAALTEIRRRFGAPVTVWLQPGREGLSSITAAALPEGIALKTIDCPEERQPSFIHAKVFAFHRPDDVVLAVGSANCSRAGLLAAGHWGNAELMVVNSVVPQVFTELFGDLVQSEATPNLPENTPSDEWEVDIPRLRILAARHEGDRLDVAFKSFQPLSYLVVEAEEGVWPATHVDHASGLAMFPMSRILRSIILTGTTAAGEHLRSSEAWVDDETSLAAPASLRRLIRRVRDAETLGGESAGEFRAILDRFRDYLRDPGASRWRMRGRSAVDKPPAPYDPASVFSEEFGKRAGPTPRQTDFGFERKGVLAIIEALFAVSSGVAGTPTDPGTSGEDPDPAAEEEKLISRPKAPPETKVKEQLRRTLRNVEAALIDPAFIEARRPWLLGEDIALAAILLVQGLADGYLEVELYRATTRRLWSELFFGSEGFGSGTITRRLDEIEADDRAAFITAFASPKLSAALTLWSLTEWNADDPEALWFRASAAQMQHRHPWLFGSAPPEAVAAELESQAASLLPANKQGLVNAAWVGLIRSGEALRLLYQALAPLQHLELIRRVTTKEVGAHELLWQANTLAFPVQTYRRESSVRAEVRFLGDSSIRKFKGDHLVPVQDLLANGVISLPILAAKEIGRFTEAATAARGHVQNS
jgi:hypothetical protein